MARCGKTASKLSCHLEAKVRAKVDDERTKRNMEFSSCLYTLSTTCSILGIGKAEETEAGPK